MITLSNVAADAQANAFSQLLNGGFLRLFDGTQPADADTPVSSQRLLAELRADRVVAGGEDGYPTLLA